MRVRPISPELLVAEVVERIDGLRGPWARVAVDGAPAADTGDFADALVEPLRSLGREVVRVRTADYLRPASLRLEHGHDDPDSFYESWFDFKALTREVLNPLSSSGSGQVLPAFWDAEADRSPRLPRTTLPERGVAIVDGPLLLGAGLAFDFAVQLWLPEAALERRTPAPDHWTLPAFRRYAEEVAPERLADYVVRVDRPGRPAVIDSLE
ncbi:uridine kinase [Saccharopolyspora sp. ASAGF58]|uniref:uridine kinase n=1 Tax=Saccharopolyspora sp. ASAGF58 TaxID=2719023 RepID=UPI0014401889|nr:uridine kinase [Saccharopolyspora sp. ASAGF58]QIZ33747.1 uridine kinase [Saccharopolyspora sp. ASAGF58]